MQLTGYTPPDRAFPRMTKSGLTFSWSTHKRLKYNGEAVS